MVAPYPRLDERRAAALYRELAAIASVLLPQWRGTEQEGEFGQALLRISARLAEHVSSRLDQTPQRDALAFFHMLELPTKAPRPASAPLVFLLAKQRQAPVFMPPGIQVGASSDDGELLFETTEGLKLTAARLTLLVAADAAADRIERTPPGFLELAAPTGPLPEHRALSFAEAGSVTMQVEPAEGLATDELIRIDGISYRLSDNKEGLLSLKDPLEANVVPNSRVEKITRFDAFQLRDLQLHTLYMGHDELLKLEEKATITVAFEPPGVAQALMGNAVSWALFATADTSGDGEKTTWHPLQVNVSEPGQLVLTKNWQGKVESTKVGGRDGLWLRANHPQPISDTLTDTHIRRIDIAVRTEAQDDADNSSPTISQAFHNGTPLPLTTRFLPFGTEPQRFDTFALAAPETLSKKGATATLKITMPDASIPSWDIALASHEPLRAYAVGANGYLQGIAFHDDKVHWQALKPPEPLAEDAAGTQRQYSLSATVTPQAVELQVPGQSIRDLVVAGDAGSRLWAQQIYLQGSPNMGFAPNPWQKLPALDGEPTSEDLLLLRRANPSASPQYHALLLMVDGENLRRLTLRVTGSLVIPGNWETCQAQNDDQVPEFGANTRLVPVLQPDWPRSTKAFPHDIVVLDEAGKLWSGRIAHDNPEIDWSEFPTPATASPRIRPVAIGSGENRITVFAAQGNDDQSLRSVVLRRDANQVTLIESDGYFRVTPGTTFQCLPSAQENIPLAVIFGQWNEQPAMALWTHLGEHHRQQIPPSLGLFHPLRGFLLPGEDAPLLVLNGAGELLHRNQLVSHSEELSFERFHALIFDDQIAEGDYYIRLGDPGGDELLAPFQTSNPIYSNGKQIHALALDWLLTAGERSLFRHDGEFQGEHAADQQTALQLSSDDATTDTGSFLIIENRLHRVVDIDSSSGDRIATLDPPLPDVAGTVDYVRVSEVGSLTVADEDLGTLLQLTGASAPPRPTELLRFADGASPPVQAFRHVGQADDSPSVVVLEQSWASGSAPPQSGQAGLLDQRLGLWGSESFDRGYQNPELAWEYQDGTSWRRLEKNLVDTTNNLARSGTLSFTVPDDLEPGEVAGQEDYWIRARLVGGDYGRARYIVESETNGDTTTQTVTVDTSGLQPPEIIHIEAYFEATSLVPAQTVLTHNNLDLRDQTQASRVDNAVFEPYEGVWKLNGGGASRMLYFGFDKPFDVRPLSLFVDAEDQTRNDDLEFQVLGRDRWHRVSADDQTRGFNQRGFVRISVDITPRKARLFGRDLHWLRVGPKRLSETWTPRLRQAFINAANAEQAKTVTQELLGSSIGEPVLTLTLGNQPVLPDSLELRVRETLGDEERQGLDVAHYPELSLAGDWVRWQRVDSFLGHGPEERVYRLDPISGRVSFGPDTRSPPAGRDNIRAIRYRTGGGGAANVAAFAIQNLKSAVEAVETVANPVATAGGSDTPAVEAQIADAPARLRRGERALTPADIEALAVSTSPQVIRARCLFPDAPGAPIRVAVAVRTGERCPRPSLAARQALAKTLRAAGWGALDEEDLEVRAPEYVPIYVQLRLQASAPQQVAALEQAATERLRLLLDPLDGGPLGQGWPFGQRLWESDVLRALADLPDLHRVEMLRISPVDARHDLAGLPPLAMICADTDGVEVIVEARQGGN